MSGALSKIGRYLSENVILISPGKVSFTLADVMSAKFKGFSPGGITCIACGAAESPDEPCPSFVSILLVVSTVTIGITEALIASKARLSAFP